GPQRPSARQVRPPAVVVACGHLPRGAHEYSRKRIGVVGQSDQTFHLWKAFATDLHPSDWRTVERWLLPHSDPLAVTIIYPGNKRSEGLLRLGSKRLHGGGLLAEEVDGLQLPILSEDL